MLAARGMPADRRAALMTAFEAAWRTERFQMAEKLAMEAPVKMIGPLVIFIFPVTFIIIFFPLVMQFLETQNH